MYVVSIHNGGVSIPIHDSKEKLLSGKVTKGINTIDSFQFSMLPSSAGFDKIHDYTTLVSVFNTNKRRYEFYGRVLYSEDTMSESGEIQKDVICESYFGFLCDSQQEYVAERNWTIRGLLEHIVNTHNDQVESYKRFVIGEVNMEGPNDNLYCGIQWANTWETINEKLLDALGGEIRFRVEGETIYLDYLAEIGKKSSTEITMSRNMKSISREKDPSEVITRLIPLGSKKEGSEERLDITSANNGKNYIEDAEAVALYGVRVAVVEFDDITIASNLLKRGLEWLAENNRVRISYTATALDLSLIGLDVDDFDVYNYHAVKNPLLGINDTVRIVKKSIDVCEEVKSTIEFGDNIVRLSELMRTQASRIRWINSRYATTERLMSEIDSTKKLISQTEQNLSGKFDDYAPKSQVTAVVDEYIESEEGIATIRTALSGTYVGKDELTGYVKTAELNTTVEQYLNTEEGKASIASAVNGAFVTEDKLSGYLEKTELSTQIGQYIDGTTGKAKIISACSSEYQKKSDMSDYVKTTSLSTSIEQYVDSSTGKAKIISAVSGEYQTKSGMSDYVKTTALSEVEQSVSDVEAAITLSTTYSKNTIGTNVQALLQLVSNPNSSLIKIMADKIDFTGFATFLRASDIGASGTTTIDGGRITTGKISADRIDVGSLKVNTIYGSGSYSATKLLSVDGINAYLGGTTANTTASNIYITASNSIVIGDTATGGVRYYAVSDYFAPITAGAAALGNTSYPWGGAYIGAGSNTAYYWKIADACITPSSSGSTTQFMIGSSTYPITTLYTKNIEATTALNCAGASMKIGGSTSYYIQATTNRELCPNSTSTTYPFRLGSSSYYWHYAYIGSVESRIGSASTSKLGFFGKTPAAQQTVSSSATVATLITALKAYGLIS